MGGNCSSRQPIGERAIIPADKFVKKIDLGERSFFFRLTSANEASLERLAQEYNMPPYACNVFPAEEGLPGAAERAAADAPVPVISNRDIVLVTMKKQDGADAYILRLVNNFGEPESCALTVGDASILLAFGRYEVKTIVLENGTLREEPLLLI